VTEPENPSPVAKEVEAVKANLGKIPLAEKVLASIALVVIVGWILIWFQAKGLYGLFGDTFTTLSFLGALAVATIVILKLFGVRPVPPNAEEQLIPIVSLLPVFGYLIQLLNHFSLFLTVGGSIALAYVSATTYWRSSIPHFATSPLPTETPSRQPPSSPPPSPAPTP
jgi:hypothetical protein